MQIDWTQKVAGISLIQIRDILRYVKRYSIHQKSICDRLEFSGNRYSGIKNQKDRDRISSQIIAVLEASDIIKEKNPQKKTFNITLNGAALCNASLLPRMKRKDANKAVNKLEARIKEINSNPIYMHEISKISLFGSYIEDAEDLGDIDVGYELTGKWDPNNTEDFEKREKELEDQYPSPKSLSYIDFWAEKVILRHLRVNRRINFSEMRKVERLGCAQQIIYPTRKFIEAEPGWEDPRTVIKIIEH